MNGTGCKRKQATLATVKTYTSSSPIRITTASLSCDTNTSFTSSATVTTRRGCILFLDINLSQPLTSTYTITVSFIPTYGPKERSSIFRAVSKGKGIPRLCLSIDLPSNFPVGYYDLQITMSLQSSPEILLYTMPNALTVIFNCYFTEDEVYINEGMEDYVHQNIGVIWRGTDLNPLPLLWEYGQNADYCLDVALSLLKNLSADKRRSAMHVAFTIMSRICPSDGSGILSVSYNNQYIGGVHPCKWNSSVPILQKFYRTKLPVKFGQCWICAGVAITLLRCLGIPCRPVTCYNAAMTGEKLGKVNCYFTPEGNLMDNIKSDSIWAYHVLIECWMRRDDLPVGYDGWQVLDCLNDGPTHCVGPIPVKALHENEILKSDISYFSSMINSEVRYYRVTKSYATMTNHLYTLAQIQSNKTGTKIITSSKTKDDCIDITTDYCQHYSDGALCIPPSSPYPYPPPSSDCHIKLDSKNVSIGKDFDITVTLHNDGPMVRTIDGRVIIMSIQYTGKCTKCFISMQFEGAVTPQKTASVILPITSKQYLRHLKDQNLLNVFLVAKTRETNQLFLISRYLQLEPLSLSVKTEKTVMIGESIRVTLSFHNCLTSSLSRILFILQAHNLCVHKEISYRHILLPGKVAQVYVNLKATVSGQYTLLASMHCDQLTDIHGWTQILVI